MPGSETSSVLSRTTSELSKDAVRRLSLAEICVAQTLKNALVILAAAVQARTNLAVTVSPIGMHAIE